MLLKKHKNIVVSDKLTLRPIQDSDAQIIFEATLENREHLEKWLPWVSLITELQHTRSFVQRVSYETLYAGKFALIIEYEGAFAGIVDFHRGNENFRSVDMGYWLKESFTGKGIMRLSCASLIEYAFENSNLNRVTIKVPTGNYRSQEIAVKLGFIKEGIEREGAFLRDEYIDINVNSILRVEWQSGSVRQGLKPMVVEG